MWCKRVHARRPPVLGHLFLATCSFATRMAIVVEWSRLSTTILHTTRQDDKYFGDFLKLEAWSTTEVPLGEVAAVMISRLAT